MTRSNGKPVIFLDMDGVLVTFASQAAGERRRRNTHGRSPDDTHDVVIDPVLVRRLDWLCTEADAVVVVSSSWRKGSWFVHLPGQLARLGLTAPVIGSTPILDGRTPGGLYTAVPRGTEITSWLWGEMRAGRERTRYVVLDDETDAGQGHEGRFVQCSMTDGLTEERAAAALAILRGEP